MIIGSHLMKKTYTEETIIRWAMIVFQIDEYRIAEQLYRWNTKLFEAAYKAQQANTP